MTKKLTFIAFLVFSVNLMFSQKTITGNVSDENGPLPGANIIELGTNNGVSTDFDGNFEITVEGNSSMLVGSLEEWDRHTALFPHTVELLDFGLAAKHSFGEVIVLGPVA